MTNDRRAGPFELHVEPPEGDGELLVLVHGGWTDSTTWARLVPSLRRSFAVVRYDRRGHSRSPRGLLLPSRRQHEDDLAVLLERRDRGPVHVAGTSYGAAIALGLAGRRPDLVRSVVAHEPVVDPIAPGVAALFASVADQIAAGDAAAATRRFFEVVVLGPGGWASVPEPVRRAAIGNAGTFVDMLADPAWAALDTAAVRRFRGPVLITHGNTGPPWLRRAAIATAEAIGAPAVVIPGAGHTPHHTHPDVLAALIERHAADGRRPPRGMNGAISRRRAAAGRSAPRARPRAG